jgi:hypothetical protein
MKKRTSDKEKTIYLEEKDLYSETEIDENGHTLYCKWGKKRRFQINDPPALFPFGRPQYKNMIVAFTLLFCGMFFLFTGY